MRHIVTTHARLQRIKYRVSFPPGCVDLPPGYTEIGFDTRCYVYEDGKITGYFPTDHVRIDKTGKCLVLDKTIRVPPGYPVQRDESFVFRDQRGLGWVPAPDTSEDCDDPFVKLGLGDLTDGEFATVVRALGMNPDRLLAVVDRKGQPYGHSERQRDSILQKILNEAHDRNRVDCVGGFSWK